MCGQSNLKAFTMLNHEEFECSLEGFEVRGFAMKQEVVVTKAYKVQSTRSSRLIRIMPIFSDSHSAIFWQQEMACFTL